MNTYKGYWFVPTNPSIKVRGILKCDSIEGNTLEIENSFSGSETPSLDEPKKAEIILGETLDGIFVTLYNCFVSSREWGSEYKAEWYAWQVFIGCHATDKKDLRFTEVALKISPLFMWLNNSGISIERTSFFEEPFTFIYKSPESIDFVIDENISGKIIFKGTIGVPNSYAENIKLSHWSVISIYTRKDYDLTYDDLWRYVEQFIYFLTFATGYACKIESTSFYHRKDLIYELVPSLPIELVEVVNLFSGNNINKIPTGPRDFFFSYDKIQEFAPSIFKEWFELYSKIGIIIKILADNLSTEAPFSEFHFKDTIQALEAFHRKLVRNERMPKEEFNKFKEGILNQIGDSVEKEYVRVRISNGNEPSLKERLIELIELNSDISHLVSIIGDKDKFVKAVVENRNFHTHLDSTGKRDILDPPELFDLSKKALILLYVCVLGKLTNDRSFIDQIIIKSNRWRFLIKKSDRV